MRTIHQNNPPMKVKIEQAIAMARNNESLEGLVIEDLQDTQVRDVDALALAEHGVLLPEQNIYYNDEDIAYDPDFDEVEWSKEPLKMTWEEKMELAAQIEKNAALSSKYWGAWRQNPLSIEEIDTEVHKMREEWD